MLAAGPLGFGAVHEAVFIPGLVAIYVLCGLSWARAHWARGVGHHTPKIPGRGLLWAFLALVLLQLLPLPSSLLGVLSPGSYAFHANGSVPLEHWHPITVDSRLTSRGLAFLPAMALLFGAAYREFRDPLWARRLALALSLTGAAITIAGLVQHTSLDPGKIYGIWRPQYDYTVFGPYVNKNHFAGFLVMATPLALGLALQAARGLKARWEERRVGWLALGDPEGASFLRLCGLAMLLVVGVLVSESRGGVIALGAALVAMSLRRRHRRRYLAGCLVLVVVSALWVDLGPLARRFQKSVYDSRIALWVDQAQLIPSFPVFGVGFNALGPIYREHQTVNPNNWFDQAHNEYLQVVLDTGLLGAFIFSAFFIRLLRSGWRISTYGPLELGFYGALVGAATSNLSDFNWQIPANAAAFVAVAGTVWRRFHSP